MEDDDIQVVIIGAGISGLATALALHKKGIKSVVMERSETLRNDTGSAIGIQQNGWRALDQLGVADILRRTAVLIPRECNLSLDGNKRQEFSMSGETRCLSRKVLLDTLYDSLPPATVKLGCQLQSIKLDPNTNKPLLHFIDGTSIIAKVVIGCDGGRSVFSDFLSLKPTKMFPTSSVRGLTEYPNGHSFQPEFSRFRKHNISVGRTPIDDKVAYWFCGHPHVIGDKRNWEDPEVIRRSTVEMLHDFPQDVREMIETADIKTFSLTRLRYRTPWDMLFGTFSKGTVAVAGDAMHVMGPFLGQGGSAGLEDAVVLARNMARTSLSHGQSDQNERVIRVEEALSLYVKERRMRVFWLSLQTYLTGTLLASSSNLKKFVCIVLLVLLFRNRNGHNNYDCGRL